MYIPVCYVKGHWTKFEFWQFTDFKRDRFAKLYCTISFTQCRNPCLFGPCLCAYWETMKYSCVCKDKGNAMHIYERSKLCLTFYKYLLLHLSMKLSKVVLCTVHAPMLDVGFCCNNFMTKRPFSVNTVKIEATCLCLYMWIRCFVAFKKITMSQ